MKKTKERYFIQGTFINLNGSKKYNFKEPLEYFMGTYGKPFVHDGKTYYTVIYKGIGVTVTPIDGKAFAK